MLFINIVNEFIIYITILIINLIDGNQTKSGLKKKYLPINISHL